MKKTGCRLLWAESLALILVFLQTINAQWVRTAGPEGGRILSLVMNDSVVIAGTDHGGVFRSTDKGATWNAAGLGDAAIECLCMQGTTVLAGGQSCKLFRSTDNGTTWTVVDSMMNIRALAADGDTVYAGVSVRVHRSIDGGRHWTQCAPFAESAHGLISSLDTKDSMVFAGTTMGNFMSTDNGATWDPAAGDYHARKGTALFAAARVAGSIVNREWFGSHLPTGVTSLVISGSRIIVVTDNSLIYSSVDDTAWITTSKTIANKSVNVLAANGSTVIAGTGVGIVRSTNNGSTWAVANTGLTNTGASVLASAGGKLFAAYNFTTYEGILCSPDEGVHWTQVMPGRVCGHIHSFLAYGNQIYAGTDSGVYRSTDGGVWTESNDGLGRLDVRSMAANGTRLFAGAYTNGLYSSTDLGVHWNKLDFGFGSTGVFSVTACDNRVYASCRDHYGVQMSADNGTSWTSVNTGLAVDEVDVFAVAGDTVFAGTHYGIYRKANGAAQWQAVNTGIDTSGLTSVSAITVCGSALFAVIFNKGVYMSTDNGSTWNDAGHGLVTNDVTSMAECNGTLFLGTIGCGIWKRQVAEITGIRGGSVPFSSSRPAATEMKVTHGSGVPVTVTFTLSQVQMVTCSVHDLSGRRVAMLANNRFMPGEHCIAWYPRNSTKGCYVIMTRIGTVYSKKSVIIMR